MAKKKKAKDTTDDAARDACIASATQHFDAADELLDAADAILKRGGLTRKDLK